MSKLENKSSILHFRRHGYSAGQYNHEKNLQNFYDREQEVGGRLDVMEHLKKVLFLINSANLDDECQNNEEQAKLIQEKKDKAKELIQVVLKKLANILKQLLVWIA